MSVSGELLCSFELLKPLDSAALKNHIKKGRNKRNSILSSPVSSPLLTYSPFFSRQGLGLGFYPCATMPRLLSLITFMILFAKQTCSLRLYQPKVTKAVSFFILPRPRHAHYVTVRLIIWS